VCIKERDGGGREGEREGEGEKQAESVT